MEKLNQKFAQQSKFTRFIIMIIIDDREQRSGICNELSNLNIPFELHHLEIGDYIINNEIYIERKTISDFIESLSDSRLFRQVHDLRTDNKRAILVIEGKHLPGRPAIRGAMASISARWYMPILRTSNIAGTAWLLEKMHSFEKYENKPYSSYDYRKKRSVASLEKNILLQLRQFGPDLADRLLKRFGSIGGILSAHDEDLMQVKGFGNTALSQIYILRGKS